MTRHRLLAFALALPLWLGATGPAQAWEFVSAMNAYGDTATGIVQPARNVSGAIIAIGCDRDRWRLVAIGPPAGGGIELDPEGEVRLSFGAEPGPKGTWQVRKRGKSDVAYLAPSASALVREMLGHQRASADAVLRVDVRSKQKPVTLEFPLAGLRAAIRKDLWEPCKLGNQIPESEFDQE